MKKQFVVVSLCTSLIYPNLALKTQAQTEQTAPCKDIPSCVVSGTVVIGGAIYYVIKNTVTGIVQRVPAKQLPAAHSNEQHEEKLVNTTTKGKSCEEIAEDLSKETGKKWRVKKKRIIPFTGPLWQPPGNPVQFECLLTTEPEK